MKRLHAVSSFDTGFNENSSLFAESPSRTFTIDFNLLKLVGISFFAVFLRIHTFIQKGYWNIDEPSWRIIGNMMAEGSELYKDIAIQLPPTMLYIYSWLSSLLGPWDNFPVYLFGAVWIMITTMFIGFSFFALRRPREGLLAAFFYAVFSTFFIGGDFLSVNGELISNGFFAICIFLITGTFIKEKEQVSTTQIVIRYAVIGIFAALAASVKAQAGILFISIILYLSTRSMFFWSFKENYRRYVIYPLLSLIAGFAVSVLYYVILFYFKGTLSYAIHFVLGNELTHASEHGQYSLLYFTIKLIYKSFTIILASFPLWLFAFLAMSKGLKNRIEHSAKDQLVLIATIWAALTWIPTAMGARFFSHYYLMFLVPLCILAASIAIKYMDKKQISSIKSLALINFSMIFIGLSILLWFALNSYGIDKFKEGINLELKSFINNFSEEDDKIFIWGYAPQWYLDAKRQPAAGFYSLKQLVGAKHASCGMFLDEDASAFERLKADIIRVPGYKVPSDPRYVSELAWEMFEREWSEHPPKIFVDTSPTNLRGQNFPAKNYPRLMMLLKGYKGPVNVADNHVYYREE